MITLPNVVAAVNSDVKRYSRFRYFPLMVVQLILVALLFFFCEYDEKDRVYAEGFEGTHVMIFIGFGFLMTFLKKYSYSALGLNWLLSVIAVQWALLCQNFFEMKELTIKVSKYELLEADIMAATVLITFGVLLGVASSGQLLFITLVEVTVGCLNLWIVTEKLQAADVGGSICIHAFGAYFGLGASLALNCNKKKVENPSNANPPPSLNGPSYISDVTSMIGSIFLFIYWPSFNSGLTESNASYQRAVINTYLSLASASVTAFILSSMVNHEAGKFDMVHVQNSTLAGGVGVGAVCNMMIGCGGATAVGVGAGIISVIGFRYITPWLEKKCGILDTCGVNNLHGMPGVYSGLLSILFASIATSSWYGKDLPFVFSAMPARSAQDQAMNQAAGLGITMVLSSVSGFITGLLARCPVFDTIKDEDRYNDKLNWVLPE